MKNKIFILTLLTTIAISINAQADGEYDSDNLHWTFYNGVLTVSKKDGATSDVMPDYGDSYAPWYSYKDQITTVVINDGLSNVGGYAFSHLHNLTSVSIPDSVKSIDRGAFVNAWNLESITIPKDVTSIGDWAFYSNGKLKNINIPDTVTSIGDRAFQGDDSLTNFSIPSSLTSIGNEAFEGATGLGDVVLPSGVISIGDSAFAGSDLTSINLPNTLKNIGYGAFAETDLTSIEIPNSVTSIGGEAFRETNITEVDIPNSVTNISPYAFAYMDSLKSITIPENLTFDPMSIIDNSGAGYGLDELYDAISACKNDNECDFYEEVKADFQANASMKNINIYCKGDVQKCEENISWLQEYQDIFGTPSFKISVATVRENNPDGSSTIKTWDGKLIGYKNKRIYTIDEANAVAGKVNSVKIRYR